MEKEISKATLKRLPTYLAYLKSLPEGSSVNISATALAAGLHMGEVQVRKDLALVSSGGRPKIGYNRAALIADIEQFLGYGNTNDAVLIGAGKLGRALLGYSGFAEYGLNIVAAFDSDASVAGTDASGKPVCDPGSKSVRYAGRHESGKYPFGQSVRGQQSYRDPGTKRQIRHCTGRNQRTGSCQGTGDSRNEDCVKKRRHLQSDRHFRQNTGSRTDKECSQKESKNGCNSEDGKSGWCEL